ncbi:MAG: hypothetical protein RL708_1958 [Bacteroidota bacterium]|jgi:hypothetical protein
MFYFELKKLLVVGLLIISNTQVFIPINLITNNQITTLQPTDYTPAIALLTTLCRLS